MVRLIPVERRGKTVWIEDAPAECAQGHRQLRPGREPCPDCGDMVRTWRCGVGDCPAPLQIDDEHEHGAGRVR